MAWWKRQFLWKGGKHRLIKDTAANVDLSFIKSLLTVLVLWLIVGKSFKEILSGGIERVYLAY